MINLARCFSQTTLESHFRGAKVLVTGGLGLVGSWLATRLVNWGAEVTLVDSLDRRFGGSLQNIVDIRSHTCVVIADIRDAYVSDQLVGDKDYIFNVAGQSSHVLSMANPLLDLEINVTAHLTLLESCRKHNLDVKIVFTSTRQIYGIPAYLPVDEAHPLDPADVNGVHKLAAESYHLLFAKLYGLRVTILRLTNTYGAGMRIRDDRQMFLGIWIRSVLEGKSFYVYGDGTQLRDFNHAADVAQAMAICAASTQTDGEIYNLGGQQETSLACLAKLVVTSAGKGAYYFMPFPEERKRIDIGSYIGDYRKIENSVGWTPRISLEAGLMHTLEYYSRFGDYYLDG